MPIREDGTREYSNSALQAYKNCPLAYFYKYEIGLAKQEEGASEHHLVYGKAMHEALKKIYLGDSLEASISTFQTLYPVQLDLDDKAKTQENGVRVLREYVKHWAATDKKWKVIAVEQKESFGYVEDGFCVVLDLVMENIEHSGIYGFDHKIVGGKKANLTLDFWNQFEPNSQVTKYYSYIESKYGTCSGFYINAIGMGFRSRAYKGEPAGFHWKFQRQMFNRNSAQLQMEREDTKYWIGRVEESKRSGQWGANTEACRFCTFRPICMAGWNWKEDRELIEIQYVANPQVAHMSENKESVA